MTDEVFEITTQIGCSIQCLKYCPQELITSRYKGERKFTLETFKKYISMVPPNVSILFAGVSEPFLNRDCAEMIVWAHDQGHSVGMATTLTGLTPFDADRILNVVSFDRFTLHLPDAEGNAHIPITDDYLKVLGKVLTRVKTITFMNMGYNFVSNRCEDMARGVSMKRRSGRVYCDLLKSPNYQLLPNGDVFFCCMVRGLSEKVGSLNENTYAELIGKFGENSSRMQNDPASICHVCSFSKSYNFHRLEIIKSKIFGDKMRLFDIFNGGI